MFTVLVRYKKSRRETLLFADSVEYTPPHTADDSKNVEPGLLLSTPDGAQQLGLTDLGDENYRDVFVMNASGQTVARYTL